MSPQPPPRRACWPIARGYSARDRHRRAAPLDGPVCRRPRTSCRPDRGPWPTPRLFPVVASTATGEPYDHEGGRTMEACPESAGVDGRWHPGTTPDGRTVPDGAAARRRGDAVPGRLTHGLPFAPRPGPVAGIRCQRPISSWRRARGQRLRARGGCVLRPARRRAPARLTSRCRVPSPRSRRGFPGRSTGRRPPAASPAASAPGRRSARSSNAGVTEGAVRRGDWEVGDRGGSSSPSSRARG